MTRTVLTVLALILVGSAALGAVPARGAAGGHAAPDAEQAPVPTGAELAARCERFRAQVEFMHGQLKARTVLARWDHFRAVYARRHRFVERHCDGSARDGEAAH